MHPQQSTKAQQHSVIMFSIYLQTMPKVPLPSTSVIWSSESLMWGISVPLENNMDTSINCKYVYICRKLDEKYTYHGCCHNLLAPRVVELSTLRISMVLKNENNIKQVFLFSGEPLHKYNSICTGSENQQQTICTYVLWKEMNDIHQKAQWKYDNLIIYI